MLLRKTKKMGRTLDADLYFPCLKCDIWMPKYAKEIHIAECHELGFLSFSHPYIVGSSMFGQVMTIEAVQSSLKECKITSKEIKGKAVNEEKKSSKKVKDEESKKTKKKKKCEESSKVGDFHKSQVEEPDWLTKIFGDFHYRIVLLNERDLIRCDICAYNPVLVEHGNTSIAFLAIPDESVRIGHIILHQNSSTYLPALTQDTFLWVKKIASVEYVSDLLLMPSRPLSEKECTFFEQQLKSLLFFNFPLGAPFTLNIGSKVYLSSSDSTDVSFTVNDFKLDKESIDDSVKKDDSLLKQIQSLNNGSKIRDHSLLEESENIPSQLLTLDEWRGSEFSSLAEGFSKLQVEGSDKSDGFMINDFHQRESMEVSNSKFNVFTSTPKKHSDGDRNMYKALHASNVLGKVISGFGKDESNIEAVATQKCSDWIRVGRNTKIRVHRLYNIDTEDIPKLVAQKEKYCRDKVYISLLKVMQTKLKDFKFGDNPLLRGWSGVLLYGPPGTGKTLMVNQAASDMNISLVTLSLADITRSSVSGHEHVRHKFRLVCECAPSVLFLDDVESLCPAGEHKARGNKDLTPAVVRGIQTLQTASKPVLLIAASSRPDAIASKLRCSGRLDREIMVPLPDSHQRQDILHQLLSSHCNRINQEEIAEVAKQAYGFSGADLSVLLRCAWLSCVKRFESQKNCTHQEKLEALSLSKQDLLTGLHSIVPTMLRQDYSAVSMVKWSDIWGYQEIKSKLQAMIQQHIGEPERHLLKGLFLYGPPGCSKTMFVRALVNETSFSFFPLKCSDLLSKYVGETEKSLNKVFNRALQAAPSIIFMDEVDSLCGDRGSSGGLVSELLSLMSHTVLAGNILVIGATNRPHAIDEALLRPGCFEQVIHVDLPDFDCRLEIWKGILQDIPLKGQVDIGKLSEATAGYSGAEITAIYQQAAHAAITQLIVQDAEHTQDRRDSQESITISEELLLKAIKAVPSRTPTSLLESIDLFTSERRPLNAKVTAIV